MHDHKFSNKPTRCWQNRPNLGQESYSWCNNGYLKWTVYICRNMPLKPEESPLLSATFVVMLKSVTSCFSLSLVDKPSLCALCLCVLTKKGYYTISPYDDGYVSSMFHLHLINLPTSLFPHFFWGRVVGGSLCCRHICACVCLDPLQTRR